MPRLQRWPKGFACSAVILVQQLPSGMFFSCHVRAVQWPPYFLQGSNRHNNKNKEQPWSSLHFSLPRLSPTERGELEKVPSRLFRVCSRWWYKKTLHSRSSSRDLVGRSTYFFLFFFLHQLWLRFSVTVNWHIFIKTSETTLVHTSWKFWVGWAWFFYPIFVKPVKQTSPPWPRHLDVKHAVGVFT